MAERWRIFVVEDEESLNWSIVNSLRKDGFAVNGATNGRDAVRVLWAEIHDIVICDLHTPGAEGFELLRWLRAYRPNTRVLLVGNPDPILRTQALESGAVGYLEKPLDMHRLKEELRRLLLQTGFSADLDSFDLLDVIQIVSSSRRSIALLISTGLEERGMLCFHNGNLVWAEYGALRGEAAFFVLAAHKAGTVVHQPWNQHIQPNVTQPLSRLVLQALEYRNKYNQMQQLSGEQIAITSAHTVQEPEDDDAPFQVLTEHVAASTDQPGVASAIQSSAFAPITVSSFEQDMAGRNGKHDMSDARDGKNARDGSDANGASENEKEWWEQTGKLSGIAPRPTPGRVPITPLLRPTPNESVDIHGTAASTKKTVELHNGESHTNRDDLPSWLTEQPTKATMPVVRPDQPTEAASISFPTTPTPAEWQPTQIQAPIRTPRKLAEHRAKETTDPQQALKSDSGTQKAASPEWQSPDKDEKVQSDSMKSLTSARRTGETHSLQQFNTRLRDSKASSSNLQVVPRRTNSVKRNNGYDTLGEALKTFGATLPGFVAAAVASMDGRALVQVTLDELDMSPLCKHYSSIMRSVFQSAEISSWGTYEDIVITSADTYIRLHPVKSDGSVFLVLVTTRDVKPFDNEAAMKNAEAAIETVLRV